MWWKVRSTLVDPTFPPLLNGHGIAGTASVFDAACDRAAAGELGAGDVLWGHDTTPIEIAIILEPEVGMDIAAQMLPLAMAAIGDSLGALTPPQVGVTFIWPNIICINGAPAGKFRTGTGSLHSSIEKNGDVPDWMVVGLELRHLRGQGDPEPGETPGITWLGEEGGEELTRTEIIESYSRHFLTWLNHWNDDGFRPVHDSWMFRAQNRSEDVTINHAGEEITGSFLGLDDGGDMLLKMPAGDTRALYLREYFQVYTGDGEAS